MVGNGLKTLRNNSKITSFSGMQRSEPLIITQKERSEVSFTEG